MGDVSVSASERFVELQVYIGVIEKLCARLLMLCGSEQCGFNLFICDDATMTEFNLRHRGVASTTDVLSFPAQPFPVEKEVENIDASLQEWFLGDLAVSYPAIMRQGEQSGTHWFEEMAFVTVHGFYHLLGFDHAPNGDHDSDVMLITAARTAKQLIADMQSVSYSVGLPTH